MGPAIPIAIGAAKLLQGLFAGKGKSKQAAAQRAAQEQAYAAQKGHYEGNEAVRGARLDQASALLAGLQGSLKGGAPSYQISPEILARMKAPRPYAGALPADPRAGVGWSNAANMTGGIADLLEQAALGKLGQGKTAAGGVQQMTASPGNAGGLKYFCALYPTSAACGGSGGTPEPIGDY